MKQWYKSTDGKIGKIRTIKNSINGEEEINGKYGFIWKVSEGKYRACITSVRIIKKYITKHCSKGDEAIITFPLEDLNKWIKILCIRNNRNTMIKNANNFGKE